MSRFSPRTDDRRLLVAGHARPFLQAARAVDLANIPAVAKMAILTEIAGATAALVRKHAALSHVDVRAIANLVTDPMDALVVMGHNQWKPKTYRALLALPARPNRTVRKRAVSRTPANAPMAGQLELFSSPSATKGGA